MTACARRAAIVVMTILGMLSIAAMGRADAGLPSDPLRRARAALTDYDLDGTGTTALLATLGELAVRAESPADGREARFLRAMASADLVLLSERGSDPALAERVAEAWHLPQEDLRPAIQGELRELLFGAYRGAAADALDALDRSGGKPARPAALGVSGLRTGAVLLRALAAAAAADRPEQALSRLVADPCAPDSPCGAPYASLAPEGRRAVAALTEAAALVAQLRRAAAHGDPFARSLVEDLDTEAAVLERVVLRPAPVLDPSSGIAPATADAHSAPPDIVLAVTRGEVRYGWWPRVRLEEGRPVVRAPGAPVLPAMAGASIPTDFRPAVLAIDELTDHLRRELAGVPESDGMPATVGVAVSDDVPAHVVARVLHSAADAGLEPVALVGADADGALRGVAVHFVRGRRSARGQVHVRVRLGGYSLDTPRGAHDIPRVRDEGGLHFDVAGLLARMRSAPAVGQETSLDFMTVVDAGPVAAAAFPLAQARRLTVLLP